MSEAKQLDPGIYFACERGWHIQSEVAELALERGWQPDYDNAPVYAAAITCLEAAGVGPYEAFVAAVDDDILGDIEQDATDYLATLVPEGHWCGYSEGFGDWGVWEEERGDE